MRWPAFIKEITGLGFSGDGDDFAAVQTWLKENHHDHEFVEDDQGTQVSLKQMYDDRPRGPFRAKGAAQETRFQESVEAGVKDHISKLQEAGILPSPQPGTKRGFTHDVKVGKDRLADSPTGGFKSMGQFAQAVANAEKQGRPTEELDLWTKATLSTYGQEGVGVDGGFAVPPQFSEQIMVMVEGEDSILSRCDQYPLDKNAVSFPTDETTPWQTTGGILAYWDGEAQAYTQSKPALTLKELRLRKVTCLVPVTEELLEDATAIGQYVTRKAGEKLDFKVGEAIFRGTGAGQPLGFLNSGSLISVTKTTSQAATTFVGRNAIDMWSRMYGPYRRDAVWFVNQDVESFLYRMSMQGLLDTGGTASTSWGTQLYVPPGGLSSAPYGTLMGRPVIPTQHCATLGSAGDVILANMRQYVAAVKSGGVESQSSIHLWFDQDAVAFKFRLRMDGQPWRNTTLLALNGSATYSAFVTTAVRA